MDDRTSKRTDKRPRKLKDIVKHLQNRKTPEDRKRLKERARRRRQQTEHSQPRRHDWQDTDEDDAESGLQRMQPYREESDRERGATRRAGPQAHDAAKLLGDSRDGDGERLEHPETAAGAPEDAALVIGLAKGRATLWLHGQEHDAMLASELAAAQSGLIAVGDRVEVSDLGLGGLRVTGVLPRTSILSRPDPGHAGRELLLAANVDVGVIVLAAGAGAVKLGLVDRLLLALQRGNVAPLVCVNKADLLDDVRRRDLDQELTPYRELDVPCVVASASTGTGMDELRPLLAGRTCVLVGHSGVGKSSLLNALDPEHARRVNAVRAGDGKGRHTTTSSSLTQQRDGTRLIDTPGVRAFGLWRWDRPMLREAYAEIAEVAAGCRFRDCDHVHEPDCAVREAVEVGALARARYEAYRRILASLEG